MFRIPYSRSKVKNFYFKIFGFPHIATRIRGECVLSLFKNIKKHSLVLDAGAGKGQYSFELEKMGYEVIQVDKLIGIGFKRMKEIEKIFLREDKKYLFAISDITKLPFKKNTFDVIFCGDVIEHLENDSMFFKEAKRLLKKGGFLIISTPCKGFHRGKFKPVFRLLFEKFNRICKKLKIFREEYLYPKQMMKLKGHKREYTLEMLKEKGRKFGFVVEDYKWEYKFFGAFFVEMFHIFPFLDKLQGLLFPFLYPFVKLDELIGIKGTGIAIKFKKTLI